MRDVSLMDTIAYELVTAHELLTAGLRAKGFFFSPHDPDAPVCLLCSFRCSLICHPFAAFY